MSVQKIYVLPVFRVSAQGRNNYDFVTMDGSSIPAGRTKSKGVVIPIKFYRQDNKLITGLEDVVVNPFLGQECIYSEWQDNWKQISEQKELSLQTIFEIKDNVPQGTYTSLVTTPTMDRAMNDIELAKSIAAKQTQLEQFKCYLETEGTNVFDNTTQRGRLSIQLCKNHPIVAKSYAEVNPDVHEFYIGEEEEAVKQKVEKRDQLVDSLANLGDLLKNYNLFTQQQVGCILKLIYSDSSENVTKSQLQDYLFESKKNSNGTQEERIEKFNTVYGLLLKEPDRIYIKYLVEQAVKNYVILLDGGKYVWKSQRGIDNYYNLGTKTTSVENLFLNEYELFDAKDVNPDNAYYKLIQELKAFGVKVREK